MVALDGSVPAVFGEVRQPRMMAIGDSLFNGVQSLTIHAGFASRSVPALVADALGFDFVVPDYPRPILLDIPHHLRNGIDLDQMGTAAIANGRQWLAQDQPWSQHRCFDNIAVAGYTIEQLWTQTAADSPGEEPDPDIPTLHELLERLERMGTDDAQALLTLWMNLNTRFVLNPSGHPDLEDCSAIDQVQYRRPRLLLISIGHNEGIFRGGALAKYTNQIAARIAQVPDLMAELATRLKAALAGAEPTVVLLINLIRPRAIANLHPRSDGLPPGDSASYHRDYQSFLLSNTGHIDSRRMRNFDHAVQQANNETERKFREVFSDSPHEIVFVDAYGLSDRFDSKHRRDASSVVVQRNGYDVLARNWAVGSMGAGAAFGGGGLFSLDHMHLSSLGYALLAGTIVDALAPHYPLLGIAPGAVRAIDYQAMHDNDPVLQDMPKTDFLQWRMTMAYCEYLLS